MIDKNVINNNVNNNVNQIYSKFNEKKAIKDKYNIYLKQLNNKVIQKSLLMLNALNNSIPKNEKRRDRFF